MKGEESGQTVCIKQRLAWWGKATGSQAVWGWSFIIVRYRVSSIEPDESQDYKRNSVLLSEGVSASDPCLPLPPTFARPGHKPRQCPPLTLPSVTKPALCPLTHLCSLSSRLPLLEWPNLSDGSWAAAPHWHTRDWPLCWWGACNWRHKSAKCIIKMRNYFSKTGLYYSKHGTQYIDNMLTRTFFFSFQKVVLVPENEIKWKTHS